MPVPAEPVLPDYRGACVTNLIPVLALGAPGAEWMPIGLADAERTVLLVIDGLGWHQLESRLGELPSLAALEGDAITTVAPTTTATAMTSITTGTTPGEHGVVGYRIHVPGEGVLNALRWSIAGRDARKIVTPSQVQPVEPFGGSRPPVITRMEFAGSGFSLAHLGDGDMTGYWSTSSIPVQVADHLAAGATFVFAYYDGLDKIAHTYGFDRHYEAEIVAIDELVGRVRAALPAGVALAVTADHGLVDCGSEVVALDPVVAGMVRSMSGEARFRWLHAQPGASADLLDATRAAHGDTGWIRSVEQIIDEQWLGPVVGADARRRLGDVALLARDPIGYADDDDRSTYHLTGRHGSLTAEEMHVPLLVGGAL